MINHKILATAAALAHNSKGATQEAHDLLAAHVKALTVERNRYRAALERIVGSACVCDVALGALEALTAKSSAPHPAGPR